ncbi:MAG TPA: glycosyltransferase family 39 protein [Acidobacteriota bacterium]|nr:glycosyltransferase family 39 protein [Acidobacteriota bacterium]
MSFSLDPYRRWLLFFFCLPFFLALGDSSIWDANEAFYVQTPQEMLQRGEWIVPYFNGEPRLNKPPLAYWLVLIPYKVFGVSILAERIVMALLAAGSVLIVYALGSRLFNPLAALWGTGVFATSFRFLILSRRLLIDVLLLFCVLAALWFFVRWVESGRKKDFLTLCVFMGLGMLAKGPVALIPVAIFGLYLLLSRRLDDLRQAPWLRGALVFASISASWFVLLAWQEGWQPVIDFFLTENLGRFSHVDFGPDRGPFYYVGVFLTEFAPWSFLFPFALLAAWRGRSSAAPGDSGIPLRMTERGPSAGSDPDGSPGIPACRPYLLLGLWAAFYFVVFSLSHNKQEYYILPVYPATALMVGVFIREGLDWPSRILGAIPPLLAAGAFGILAWSILLGDELALGMVPSLLLAAASFLLLTGRGRWAVLAMSAFYSVAFTAYLEPLERYKPVRPLCRAIQQQAQGQPPFDYQAGYYRLTSPSMAYYLDHPVLEIYDPHEALRYFSAQHPVFLIMQEGDFHTLQRMSGNRLEIVDVKPKLYTTARNLSRVLGGGEDQSSHWTRPVYLVSNRRGN